MEPQTMEMPQSRSKAVSLPPYRALFAVDAERYSGNPSVRLPFLKSALGRVVEQTLSHPSVGNIWNRLRFRESTGDGMVFMADLEVLPFLIDPWLNLLHLALTDMDEEVRRHSRDMRLRLRVSMHLGPVPGVGPDVPDPASTPMNEVFRYLNASPTRDALRDSNPNVTFLAALLSQRVFDDVVVGGYSGVHEDQFTPVVAALPEKDFAHPAWLYVPGVSSIGRGTTSNPEDEANPPSTAGHRFGAPTTNVAGNVGQNIVGQNFNAPINQALNANDFWTNDHSRNNGEGKR
ncbi:hypothetical protein LWF15_32925 [Kineosporia rhizophila]|uniref:hypothetical protein n=2 Tax=Kineosporia TaxID=49184 RepID=UPI001E422042|nr:hypothetical protein [Kineosporia rhizophila]MCE0540308.1 hypothetical protein [Kineosporia rhizophila]